MDLESLLKSMSSYHIEEELEDINYLFYLYLYGPNILFNWIPINIMHNYLDHPEKYSIDLDRKYVKIFIPHNGDIITKFRINSQPFNAKITIHNGAEMNCAIECITNNQSYEIIPEYPVCRLCAPYQHVYLEYEYTIFPPNDNIRGYYGHLDNDIRFIVAQTGGTIGDWLYKDGFVFY